MDEAAIKTLVSEQITAALQDADTFKPLSDSLTASVRQYMSDVLNPLEGRLDGLENAATTPEKPKADAKAEAPTDDPDSPLAKRLATLETQLQEANTAREAEAAERAALELDGHVTEVLQGFGPQFMPEAKQLFRAGLSETTKDGDRYLLKDGKTVAEAASAFFDTPVGKHFLPSKAADGLGTDKPKEDPKGLSTGDLNTMLLSAFG